MLENINKSTILHHLKKGDENAIRFLFDVYYIELRQCAKGFLHIDFLAQRIVSDFIYRLWDIRESLDEEINLRSYMLGSIKNNCINYLNKKSVRQEFSMSGISQKDFKMTATDS